MEKKTYHNGISTTLSYEEKEEAFNKHVTKVRHTFACINKHVTKVIHTSACIRLNFCLFLNSMNHCM